MNKKIAVIGGGISGLTAAYVLAKKGHEVVVIEKSGVAGGLAATFPYKGNLLDYGPHNFHTTDPRVLGFVKDELGVELNRLKIYNSKLYFMGKILDYPLKIADAVKNLDIVTAFLCFYDYALTRITAKLGLRKEKEDSFEAWVVKRFGRRLYNLYFGPYVKKIWGIPGTELDVSVARKRILEPSLFALLVRVLTGIKIFKKHSEDPSTMENYYPPKGIGAISDRLSARIREMGGRIELGCALKEVSRGASKLVKYAKDGTDRQERWDYIINTMPINSFAAMISGSGRDGEPGNSIGRLRYRSLVFMYMFLDVEKVFDTPWVYFNEQDSDELIFNRVYEVGSFSKEMIQDGKGVICLEITCYKGDELWNSSDAVLYDKCISFLDKRDYLKRENVREYMTRRVEDVYPVFKTGYRGDVQNIMNFITRDNDIFSIGRQGLYTYANIDHCIEMALRLDRLFKDESTANRAGFFSIYNDCLTKEY